MELRQIRQLLAIVEAGGYRAAAEELRIAQPALSVSIRKLERSVGVELLARDSRGTRLTDAGAAFLSDAHHAISLAEMAKAKARATASGEVGLVRLGFVGSAVYRLLPNILPSFRARHGGVALDLREGTTVDLIPAVQDHKLDCAIVRGPLPDFPDLEYIEIERDHLVALVPSNHRLANDEAVNLVDLAKEPFVHFSHRTVPGLRNAVEAVCAAAGFAPLVAQEVTQSITMVGLVGSGLGVALSPSVIAQISGAQVRFIPLKNRDEGAPLRLLAVKRRAAQSRVLESLWKCFAELARRRRKIEQNPC